MDLTWTLRVRPRTRAGPELFRQPGAGKAEVPLHRGLRDTRRFGNLIQGQTANVVLLEDSALSCMGLFEPSQCIFQLEEARRILSG